jgi:hypothetical protein
MDKAPQFVQLALSDGQLLPQIKYDKPTMLGGAIEPRTYGIFINLDNPRGRPDRIAFRYSNPSKDSLVFREASSRQIRVFTASENRDYLVASL